MANPVDRHSRIPRRDHQVITKSDDPQQDRQLNDINDQWIPPKHRPLQGSPLTATRGGEGYREGYVLDPITNAPLIIRDSRAVT